VFMLSYKKYLLETGWYSNIATASQAAEKAAAANSAPVVIGDSIAVGIGGAGPYARGGASSQQVLGFVKRFIDTGKAKGATVILSSGASNSAPVELEGGEKISSKIGNYIDDQVKSLVDAGAAVALVGVGSQTSKWFDPTRYTNGKKYRVNLEGINTQLQSIADKYGATFLGPLEKFDNRLNAQPYGDGIHPYNAYGDLLRAGSKIKPRSASSSATSTNTGAPQGGAPKPADTVEKDTDTSIQPFSQDTKKLQQALVDAGFELPKFGVDGKMGPETRQAIRDAEKALGRAPTGTISVDELAKIKKDGPVTPSGGAAQASGNDAKKLQDALGAIEALLAKYKIKAESVYRARLANVNALNATDQMALFRDYITEKDQIIVPATSGGGPRTAAQQAAMRAAQNPPAKKKPSANPNVPKPGGSREAQAYQASRTAPVSVSPASRIGRQAAGRAARRFGAAGASALVPGIGTVASLGLAAWGIYDLAKGIYDVVTAKGFEDFTAEDQKILEDHLETIMQYSRDPEKLKSLDAQTKNRVERVLKDLATIIEIEQPEKPARRFNPANPSGVSAEYDITPEEAANVLELGSARDIAALGGREFLEKIAGKKTTPAGSSSQPSTTTRRETSSGLLIANTPVTRDQPLTAAQMSVMKMAMDMGNTYPDWVMQKYNSQKKS
jgi:peptidoglycan hydrolase-like protein with peptidoglycan-binding domain